MARKLKTQDLVTINKGEFAGRQGCVSGFSGKKVSVLLEDENLTKSYKPSALTYIPPFKLGKDAIRTIVRFEKTIDELCAPLPFTYYKIKGRYQMTLDDLETALENVIAKNDEEAAFIWYCMTFQELHSAAHIWECTIESLDEDGIVGMPSRASVFDDVMEQLMNRYEYSSPAAELPELLERIRLFLRDEDKPAIERELTVDQKEHFLRLWDNDSVELNGSPQIEALYVKYVNELAAIDNPVGLKEKAYACYGEGNAGFACDWETSRDCLLKLEDIKPSSSYANTLGYIYYYGRCNGGEPEYDKAFYWFSLGAAGGIYESRYKLFDLVRDGKGCHKDEEIARHIICDLYNENLEYFCHGWGRTKFAGIALRMGHVYRDGIDCTKSASTAYHHYLMAKLAIRMRRQCCAAFGDESVERKIDDAIASVLPDSGFLEPVKETRYDSLIDPLRFALGYGRRVRMDYKWKSANTLQLTFHMMERPGTKYESKIPLLIPEAQFCGLVEKLRVTVDVDEAFGLPGESGTVVFDEVNDEWPDYGALMLYGEKVAHVRGIFTIDCHHLAGRNRRYVSVSFGDPQRTWDYLCDEEAIQAGCPVRAPWGDKIREGVVMRVCQRYDSEVELWRKAYKRIL